MSMKSGIVFCLTTFISASAYSATITALSCNNTNALPHVSNAVKAAKNGDTVIIPAGNCTWSRGLGSNCPWADTQDTSFCLSTVAGDTKYITIQGAGIGKTIITDSVSRDANINRPTVAFDWTMNGGGLSRITGIELRGTIGKHYSTPGVCQGSSNTQANIVVRGSTNKFRIDHNKFVQHGACMVLTVGASVPSFIRGVIDHNFFDFTTDSGDPEAIISNIYTYHLSWGDVGDNGDNSWAQPDTVGTAEALFYENNVFHNAQTRVFSNGSRQYYALSLEGAYGSRIVARYNNFRSTVYTHHGTGSAIRSTRQFEIYENDFTGSTGCANNVDGTGCDPWNLYGNTFNPVIGSRGGVGVAFNNRLTRTNGPTTSWMLNVVVERTPGAPNSNAHFGACDGKTIWDQNSTPTGRLCIDQPGAGHGDLIASTSATPGCPNGPWPINVTQGCVRAWPRQVAQPNYEWGNTIDGVLVKGCHIDKVLGITPIIDEVDCKNGPRPGYSPYQYPHHLVTGTEPNPAPLKPRAPKNLRVK